MTKSSQNQSRWREEKPGDMEDTENDVWAAHVPRPRGGEDDLHVLLRQHGGHWGRNSNPESWAAGWKGHLREGARERRRPELEPCSEEGNRGYKRGLSA